MILQSFLIWLSGSSEQELAECPHWERVKHMAFGATVMVPTIFAFIAASYAISTLTSDPRIFLGVGVVWSFIILTIDRALLASYRAHVSIFRKAGQFGLRLVVALLMGVTIAHPLVLLLFRDTIHSTIEAGRQADLAALRADYNERKDQVNDSIQRVQDEIASQREQWERSFQADFITAQQATAADEQAFPGLTEEEQAELREAIAEATASMTTRLTALESQAADLTPGFATLQEELAFWQAEFEREVDGQRSGLVGVGPRARSIQDDHLSWRREEVRRIGAVLEHLSREQAEVQARLREAESAAIDRFDRQRAELMDRQREENQRAMALRRRVEADQAAVFVEQQNSMRETIRQQIDTRLTEVNRLQGEVAALNNEEDKQIAAIQAEPRRDILTQTLALHSLFGGGDGSGRFALYTYGILTLLFMLVDTIPILVKFFTRAGPYDALVNRDEVRANAEHQAFLKSHRRYMDGLAKGNLISVTRNKTLENALIDGVEHSRAANEFLDSLIEMERAFNERVAAEQARSGQASEEQVAALESMKQHFYADLHRRMAGFFHHDNPAGQQA